MTVPRHKLDQSCAEYFDHQEQVVNMESYAATTDFTVAIFYMVDMNFLTIVLAAASSKVVCSICTTIIHFL